MMRGFLLVCLMVVFGVFANPAVAQDNQAVQATIQGQLDAFRDDDFDRAFEYASPFIKGMFGNPARFGLMVQRGYPMVSGNQSAKYLELREIAGRLWQKVMVQDTSGTLHILDYEMLETPDGWQINGVQLLPAPDVGV
jgi:hypothetical protein